MKAVRWVSLGALGGAALVLVASWERLPPRWVIHWGAGGVPNGFAHRTFLGVFGPLLIGAGVWLLIEGVSWAIARAGRGAPAPEMVTTQTDFARLVGLAVCAMFAATALYLPLAQPRTPGAFVGATLALVFGAIALGLVRMARAVRALRTRRVAVPKGWEAVFWYRNPDDARLWVPKLWSIGWTLNFARRAAWPVLIALVAGPVAVALVGVAQACR